MKKNNLPNASISLDLDNQWAYMKVHGDKGWEDYPSYFNKFIPHGLEILKKYNLKITFFIVGRDADDDKNIDVLKEISNNKHEVGNHSYNHETWFELYNEKDIYKELNDTEAAIEKTTGELPIGFRGPGFSKSFLLFKVLKQKGYLYDASSLPTWIGPLARAYYFRQSEFTAEEKEARKNLFGSFSDGLSRIKPYLWDLKSSGELLEIPVSTIPFIKLPFHFSYLHYLANINLGLMKSYLQTAITMCKVSKTEPSLLLHPLDLIGGDLVPSLKFFPGMELSSSYKAEIFEIVMEKMTKNFNLINMNSHAQIILERNNLQKNTPN